MKIADTPEARKVKDFASRDLFYFAKQILGYKLLDKKLHGEMCRELEGSGDVLMIWPRGTFKTTCVIAYAIWQIVKNTDVKILYSHKVLGKGKEIMREVREHFERNEKLHAYYGDMVGEPWGDYAITVRGRKRIGKEPTLSVGAVGHEATSSHYNIRINDDLAGLEDMVSAAARAETERYYRAGPFLNDGPDTREINVCTRWATEDLAGYIMEHKPRVKVIVKQAITENGESLFPQRYSIDMLKEMQESDPVMFSAQMMNQPTNEALNLFSGDSLGYYDDSAFSGNYNVAYIDPAFGEKTGKDTCYFIMIIGCLHNGKLYIRDWVANKDKPIDNEAMILGKIREYKLHRIVIEDNGGQQEFIRNVQKEIDKCMLGVVIEGITNTVNKDRRIQAMHGRVVRDVLFRQDWKTAYPTPMLQLLQYPQAKYKDAPDALEGLVQAVFTVTAGDWIPQGEREEITAGPRSLKW